MKSSFKIFQLFILIAAFSVAGVNAQPRVIKGTVYRDGKPASGVTVTAHKSSESFFTSFDGKYELKADQKSKWIKFSFPDKDERLEIEGNTAEVIDFGQAATKSSVTIAATGDVDLRSRSQLIQAGVKPYIENASIFEQFYNQGDYKSALPHWELLYKQFPKSSENIYITGITMHEAMLAKAAENEKEAIMNKILEIYDNRIANFDHKGFLLGRKATFFLKNKLYNSGDLNDQQKRDIYKKGYEWLEASMKLEGDKTEAAVLLLLNQATAAMFKTGDFTTDKVLSVYDQSSTIVEKYLAANPGDDNYEKAKNGISRAFVESGAVTCTQLVPLYTTMFNNNPNDVATLKKINYMLNREDCSDNKLYSDVAEKLFSLEPSSQSAFSMARLFYKRKDITKAISYYDQAIATEKDKYEKANYCYELASIYFSQKNFDKARSLARQATTLNNEFGKPYILIAKLYVSSAKSVGDSDTKQRMVYCLAVDYLQKAKAADPSLGGEVNKDIATYSQYFPNKEDAFFEGLKAGDRYTVGGWINESTTVRLK